MNEKRFQQGEFIGQVRADFLKAFSESRLAALASEIAEMENEALGWGRHRVVVLTFEGSLGAARLAVKAFGKQARWKDRFDHRRGTKAARSYKAADLLQQQGVGTPTPVAYLNRWSKRSLLESYYVSEYVPELTNFRDRIRTIYRHRKCTAELVPILKEVGLAIREMHDAGFVHRDLGSQNMEIAENAAGQTSQVYFLDLNRGSFQNPLTDSVRALDFARLELPSGFLEILMEIYCSGKPSEKFLQQVEKARNNFRRWQASRVLRHPVQMLGKSKVRLSEGRTLDKNVWVWNSFSDQAAIVLNRGDRKRLRSKRSHLKIGAAVAKAGWGINSTYKEVLPDAFEKDVAMSGRIGVSLDLADTEFEPQLDYLRSLGSVPVLGRIGHHEQPEKIDQALECVEKLHGFGHDVMLAIMQDRRAVLAPDEWKRFIHSTLNRIGDKVSMVEIGHAVNRMKWGAHNIAELSSTISPVVELRKQFPDVSFSGPACIDFEFHYVVAALESLPADRHYSALSHHLYVDRRGAPENEQSGCSVVEKAAWLKAIAVHSKRCDDRVIISEVNWPLESTGIWSPVRRTYEMGRDLGTRVEVSERVYGHYMIRYLALTLCSGFVDKVYWWRLVSHGYGLIDDRGEDGWRKRIGFQMLQTFLQQVGNATFSQKLETPDDVYALQFERKTDTVTLVWAAKGSFEGPWPVKFSEVLNSIGEPIKLESITGNPCYLISS